MSTSTTNAPSSGDEEMGGSGPPQRLSPQLESEQAEVNKAYGFILKLISVLAFVDSGMITVVAQGTSRFHCVHWWIPFSLILIVSGAVTIATSCQLKKISRSPRKVVSCVAVLGVILATSVIILVACRVILCQF